MTALVIMEAVVIVLLVILVAGLLKSHAEILRQLHALGVDEGGAVPASTHTRPRTTGFEKAPATQISGVDLSGSAVSVSLEHGRGNTLLAFLSSGCATCQAFWTEFGGGFELPTPNTRTVIVTKGTKSESPSRLRDIAPTNVPLLMSSEVWDEFRVPLTPYFLLVDGDARVVGEGSAPNWKHLLGLLSQSAADAQDPVHLDTRGREQFTDIQLGRSDVKPGDPSLYENPVDQ